MSLPRLIFRTIPEGPEREDVARWWAGVQALHPGWFCITYQDPLPPSQFPITAPLWDRCVSGAQKAGLIRLEALHRHGGIYLDSDVEVFRNLGPLLQVEGFAAYEDPGVIPDAVLGAKAAHPAIAECLTLACQRLVAASGQWQTDGPWGTGPGVTTTVLAGRDDFLVLPPDSFYRIHYTQKARLGEPPLPFEFGRHHWHNSWQS